MTDYATHFRLPGSTYLLSHSVGRPLVTQQKAVEDAFFAPWADQAKEPWGDWLAIIEDFKQQLSLLFNAQPKDFCPQVNLSSALTKVLQSLPSIQQGTVNVLLTESDFPSMGFVLQEALGGRLKLHFIPKERDLTDANVWSEYLTPQIDVVFISHAFSNLGALAPINEIIDRARDVNALNILDIAQSAGVIPIDLSIAKPDVMIGSSVKWLCGGPGAGYLWMPEALANQCAPKDVGWFSHENPFEMNIHRYANHAGVQRFWGGTPSVLPYANAAHSIAYFNSIPKDAIREHNLALTQPVLEAFQEFSVSPIASANRSGTMVLDFGEQTEAVATALQDSGFEFDKRVQGIRLSPHLYNDMAQMQSLMQTVKKVL